MNLKLLSLMLAAPALINPAYAMSADQDNPRIFCTRTGGEIQETGRCSVFICCYPDRQKCVVTDTEQRLSWVLSLQRR